MTNLELLEEIRKDFIFKKNNDPIINSTLLIFITKFKERMYKLDLPVVGVTFKEKHTTEFQEFVKKEVNVNNVGNIYWYKGSGYITLHDLFKMYKKIKVKP